MRATQQLKPKHLLDQTQPSFFFFFFYSESALKYAEHLQQTFHRAFVHQNFAKNTQVSVHVFCTYGPAFRSYIDGTRTLCLAICHLLRMTFLSVYMT